MIISKTATPPDGMSPGAGDTTPPDGISPAKTETDRISVTTVAIKNRLIIEIFSFGNLCAMQRVLHRMNRTTSQASLQVTPTLD